jgi:hypothetical protein
MKRISTVIALGLLAAVPAGEAQAGKANTFSGSCHFEGVVRFTPPLTDTQQRARGSARAVGPCEGRFTDRRGRMHQLDGDQLAYVAANRGEMSCGGGVADGRGYLRYRNRKLRFKFTEARGAPAAELHLVGAKGGSADGIAHVSEQEDPIAIGQKCMGPGLDQARIEIELGSPSGISG